MPVGPWIVFHHQDCGTYHGSDRRQEVYLRRSCVCVQNLSTMPLQRPKINPILSFLCDRANMLDHRVHIDWPIEFKVSQVNDSLYICFLGQKVQLPLLARNFNSTGLVSSLARLQLPPTPPPFLRTSSQSDPLGFALHRDTQKKSETHVTPQPDVRFGRLISGFQ